MTTRKSLVWHGDKVTAKMRAAQKLAVSAVMSACVQDAKLNHTWRNQSGELERGIRVTENPREVANGVEGTWGVVAVPYALIHELGGTVHITPKSKKALAFPLPDGGVAFAKSVTVTIPPRPYLRPAADRNYPLLAEKIKLAFARQGGAHG